MRWVLDTAPVPPAAALALDADQRRVVGHRDGPLLVLAGPGTGKTTTIVEAICARLTDPAAPLRHESILALTFGRKAATELRDRVTARLGGGMVPTVATFHSFAYGLVRSTDSPDGYLDPPRLMSGAEEDVRIRELLKGALADGSIDWPEDLAGALPTLGLANEVRAVLARARELEMSADDLRRIGAASARPAWVAIGQLARQEREVMAMENVIDYTELLYEALVRASNPRTAAALHQQYRAIFVDEYQDTDPLQVSLLRALAGPGTTVVAVGDPDQAIYGFRGADVRGLLAFPRVFPAADGSPAPVLVLGTTRRFGPRIRSVAAAVLGDRLPAGLPVAQARAHRQPSCAAVDPDQDVVTVRLYDDHGAQAAHVAREVRAAHVERGVPWSRLAVLVRAGQQIAVLQRALSAAGVPAVVASDEIPLRSEPAVAALLTMLRLAARPMSATPSDVIDLLTGPIVDLSAIDIRRLGRALRRQQHVSGSASLASDVLIRDLVLAGLLGAPDIPASALPPDDPIADAVARTNSLLLNVHDQLSSGAAPGDVLWTLWTGGRTPHGWPQRLRAAALAGSRSANHDLDALMALFDAAERLSGRYPGFLGARMFLDYLADQQIPAEPVADRGAGGEAVRVLTAHRAKGLEWEEVWVVGLEEGVWPDVRMRGSTLRAEELTASGIGTGPRPADLLDEERRLLYVACTRARTRLHVSAVESSDDAGERQSRFIADLCRGVPGLEAEPVSGRPPYPLSLDGLVAELRTVAGDLAAAPELRAAAGERLALLADQRDEGDQPLVPLADPRTWWGVADWTDGARPVRDPDQPLSLSGSGLDGLLACPMKWFLEHEARAESARGPATSFGSVVHAVADFVAKEQVPADLDAMDAQVERIWGELRFEARWQSESERREARAALSRFLEYHVRQDRELVATEAEVGVEVVVPRPDGIDDTVRLRGYIDRVEKDAAGRLVPIDLKNMRRGVPDKEIPEHGQLGVYQLILREGGLPEAGPAPVEVGGAALVQLRVPAARNSADPKVQFQDTLGETSPTWVESRLGAAVQTLRTETFPATIGPQCRYCDFRTSCPAQPDGKQVTS